MRAEIIFKDYTIDVVIHPSCATESDFLVNITTGVGPQGYTPKRGIDYWTETDKEEIVVEATPERGVDYWTAADQQAIAAEAQSTAEAAAEATTAEILNDPAYKTSIKGDKGDKGDTGDPGYTPKRGIDYWTDADKEEIITDATPRRGVDYWTAVDQQIVVTEAQDAAEETAEVTATEILNDPEYKASIKGNKGDPGYTPVKGVDYFDGEQGNPGQDGVSPTITVTDITGGHRVTITDATGAHSFDVMDGDAADAPVQDVQVNGTSILDTQGVANVPVANAANKLGLVYAAGGGLAIAADGRITTQRATDYEIQVGTNTQKPIVPTAQHASTFYGLAKVAGSDEKNSTLPVGQYTESAKSAISEMLNGSVSVSGTTPTITALPGIRYVCGEVTTLDIALPASGIVDVVFESGSTPTTLTVTPPSGMTMKWVNGFDPTSLDADTTYEINIADGLGVVGTWS